MLNVLICLNMMRIFCKKTSKGNLNKDNEEMVQYKQSRLTYSKPLSKEFATLENDQIFFCGLACAGEYTPYPFENGLSMLETSIYHFIKTKNEINSKLRELYSTKRFKGCHIVKNIYFKMHRYEVFFDKIFVFVEKFEGNRPILKSGYENILKKIEIFYHLTNLQKFLQKVSKIQSYVRNLSITLCTCVQGTADKDSKVYETLIKKIKELVHILKKKTRKYEICRNRTYKYYKRHP